MEFILSRALHNIFKLTMLWGCMLWRQNQNLRILGD